jgi:hypothetical protein
MHRPPRTMRPSPINPSTSFLRRLCASGAIPEGAKYDVDSRVLGSVVAECPARGSPSELVPGSMPRRATANTKPMKINTTPSSTTMQRPPQPGIQNTQHNTSIAALAQITGARNLPAPHSFCRVPIGISSALLLRRVAPRVVLHGLVVERWMPMLGARSNQLFTRPRNPRRVAIPHAWHGVRRNENSGAAQGALSIRGTYGPKSAPEVAQSHEATIFRYDDRRVGASRRR